MLEGDTIDELLLKGLQELDRYGEKSSPRNMEINELLVQTFHLRNPRARLVTFPERKLNTGFAVGEFLWYWTGRDDLSMMLYYNKRMAGFSDDGKTLNSAYGKRIFKYESNVQTMMMSQWLVCAETLLKDPDSRRAVININRAEDQKQATLHESKDVPCTLSLQFFIRNKKLHLHVNMRSNDIMWGFCYDVFSFTLLQECMMLLLREEGMKDLGLGSYYHTAGSLHLYEQHYQLAEDIIGDTSFFSIDKDEQMDPLPQDSFAQLHELSRQEELLRTGVIKEIDCNTFTPCVTWMAEQLNAHRKKRDEGR